MNVMIIDDDPLEITLMERFLLLCDYPEPRSFEKANHALKYLVSNRGRKQSHLIFLDLNMPEMGGWEFLEAIRSTGFSNAEILVYIVSSSVDPVDQNLGLANPFVRDYLVKPIIPSTLKRIKSQIDL